MKKLIMAAIMLALCSVPVFGHHVADGIVDEDVYAMIDDLVADTPHATMELDVGEDMTEIMLTSSSTVSMEKMLDEGLLTYFRCSMAR